METGFQIHCWNLKFIMIELTSLFIWCYCFGLFQMDEDDSELLAKCKEAAVHHPDMSRPLEIMCEIHMDRALGMEIFSSFASINDLLVWLNISYCPQVTLLVMI